MSPSEMKEFIKEGFKNVIENMEATEEIYAHYFSKDYIQHVDGKTLDYKDFVAHMKAQKTILESIKVIFKYMIVEEDKIATVHIAEGVKKNGQRIKVQVHAVFQIKEGKIVVCDELTHLIEGEKTDKDIGSRH